MPLAAWQLTVVRAACLLRRLLQQPPTRRSVAVRLDRLDSGRVEDADHANVLWLVPWLELGECVDVGLDLIEPMNSHALFARLVASWQDDGQIEVDAASRIDAPAHGHNRARKAQIHLGRLGEVDAKLDATCSARWRRRSQ